MNHLWGKIFSNRSSNSCLDHPRHAGWDHITERVTFSGDAVSKIETGAITLETVTGELLAGTIRASYAPACFPRPS